MESVEWIFTDYRAHRSMLQFLQEELSHVETQGEETLEETISGMVLAKPLMDGMPHVRSGGSSTEWAVIKLNEGSHNREAIISEIVRYHRLLRLHEAVLRILTANELWFVENYYYEEQSLTVLLQRPDSPFVGLSRATMSNFKKRLLKKVETFLKQASVC